MTAEKLFLTLGEAGEPWMAERHSTGRFRFPAAIAACLLLALILPLALPGADKQEVQTIETLVWKDRIYELVESSERLDLPRMDGSRAGSAIGSARLESGGSEITLYQYLPKSGTPCEALLAVQDGEGWRYAVFCNYVLGNVGEGSAVHEPAHLLGLYGVTGPEDIVSLRADGRETSRQDDFIRVLLSASVYGEERYQSRIYGGLSDAEQQQKSRALAETHIQLQLETRSGLVFWMGYQPETGFVDWCLEHFWVG